jgi:hypothetical protein
MQSLFSLGQSQILFFVKFLFSLGRFNKTKLWSLFSLGRAKEQNCKVSTLWVRANKTKLSKSLPFGAETIIEHNCKVSYLWAEAIKRSCKVSSLWGRANKTKIVNSLPSGAEPTKQKLWTLFPLGQSQPIKNKIGKFSKCPERRVVRTDWDHLLGRWWAGARTW